MKLTKENIRKMLPGQTLTVVCDRTDELQSAYETAKQTKREIEEKDYGRSVKVSCSGVTNTVVVRMEEAQP